MVLCPVTILGGLPVIAECIWTRGDGWMTDDDFEVGAIYWRKKNDLPGKEVPKSVYEKLDKIDYWEADVSEQASDWLAYRDHEEAKIDD